MIQEHRPLKIRDRRNKGWFYLDNEYLNGYAKIFGAVGTAIYVSLCRHADAEQKCFPSQELIAKELNINQRTVIRYLQKFEKHQLIKIERERVGGKWIGNTYWLLDKTEWLSGDTKSDDKPRHQVTLDTVSGDTVSLTQVTQCHTKDTNKIRILNKNTQSSLAFLRTLKDRTEEIKEMADKYGVTNQFVLARAENVIDYCEAKGKVYKDYKATLRNFIKSHLERHPDQARPRITPEQIKAQDEAKRKAEEDTKPRTPEEQARINRELAKVRENLGLKMAMPK